jgi:hypothetical protein
MSKCRKNFSQSSPSKCGLNDNATILKILIAYGIRRTMSKCRKNFSQSSPSKCGLNDNATILKKPYCLWEIFLLLKLVGHLVLKIMHCVNAK